MASLDELIEKLAPIYSAIENALEVEGKEAVKEAIVTAARKCVYDAYSPKFLSRRNGAGGVLDPNSIQVSVIGTEIIAWDDAQWQQLYGGAPPAGSLVDAIATGDPRYHMGDAGPRPFHEQAKKELITGGALEDALKRGLMRQGIDVSDITFSFT